MSVYLDENFRLFDVRGPIAIFQLVQVLSAPDQARYDYQLRNHQYYHQTEISIGLYDKTYFFIRLFIVN